MNASDRLLDILSSRLFSVCKKNMGEDEFMKMAFEKIQPIEGDLILEGLGLSASNKEMLLNNVQIIINSAASVSFDDPLLESLNINYFGNLRMLELAKSCKHILAFCHVSTAYVNSNQPYDSFIDEEIYNKD